MAPDIIEHLKASA